MALLLLTAGSLLLLAAAIPATVFGADGFPAGPGKEIFVRVCSSCHEAEIVIGNQRRRQDWESVVGLMKDQGAEGTDAEMAQIVDYLTANFGVKDARPKVNVNTSSTKEISDGLDLTAAEGDAIVAYRTKNGRFASIDDLKKVQGVDAAKIDAARDRIAF